MRASIEFNLEDQEDRMAHLRCVKSLSMAALLWDIKFNLIRRSMTKAENSYGDKVDYEPGIELVMGMVNELFEEHNINVEELTS